MSKKHQTSAYNTQHPRSPFETLMQSKKAALLKAERDYWSHQRSLRQQHEQIAGLSTAEATLPSDISSTVWALKDGAAFVRYKSTGPKPGVGFRAWDISLEEWGQRGLIVPLVDREFSFAEAEIFRGLGDITFTNCLFNGIYVPYVEFSAMRYGDTLALPSVEQAVIDYQVAHLAEHFRGQTAGPTRSTPIDKESVIEKLEHVAEDFETLLAAGATREEELQVFIRDNPFILHPSAELIPKQKLGEDFVTDFVVATPLEQGTVFYLVEIERANHPVLIKDGALSGPANHAVKQTLDWEIWLQNHQAYLRGKLPGLESPDFIIVIGRSNGMSEMEKSYLRAYNRRYKNTKLLTYDDLLAQFLATIERLREMSR